VRGCDRERLPAIRDPLIQARRWHASTSMQPNVGNDAVTPLEKTAREQVGAGRNIDNGREFAARPMASYTGAG